MIRDQACVDFDMNINYRADHLMLGGGGCGFSVSTPSFNVQSSNLDLDFFIIYCVKTKVAT